uniref:S-crystallin 6 n=1 Tax=Idiosepius paradoxus TaxID=294707 RepID=A0A0H5ATC3_IDIPA|nr:S-crystallin 6 [Idiosepius paradoxus]
MPNYTLYYFNGRGRAEICRMMFAAAGVQYTDKRFEFNEWDRYRKEMPSDCVPVLDIDGNQKMPETMAICRYLAREFGFYGKNNMEMFRVDYICDCLYEILHDYMRYYHEKNGRFRSTMSSSKSSNSSSSSTSTSSSSSSSSSSTSTKSSDKKDGTFVVELKSRYLETCRRILPFLEKTLGTRQYFNGEQMMLCDMMCYCCLESPYMEDHTLFNNYPKLVSLRNRVTAHSKISAYLKKRTVTNW